jgi:tetratricopeptide (TPR) repeat protein
MEISITQRQLRIVSIIAVVFVLIGGVTLFELTGSSGFSNSAGSYATAGISAFKAGDLSLALQEFNQELQAAQGSPGAVAVAHYNIGTTQARMGMISAAEKNFSLAVQGSPSFAMAWFDLGLANAQLGRVAVALHAYDKFLKLQPTNASALLNSGVLMYQHGQKVSGLTRIKRALSLDSTLRGRVPLDIPLN